MTDHEIHMAFVTGGSGFVGRNLIETLQAHGVQVRALARSNAAIEVVQKVGAEAIKGDLQDKNALSNGMAGCNVVFHVAAKIDDWGRYEDFYQTNVVGTENVLASALATGVKRVVYVSTEAVLLGAQPIVNANETHPRPEHPLGLYGQTKGLAEERVRQANSPTLATIIVRPRLIWGKGDTTVLERLSQTVRSGSFMWIDGGHYLTSTCNVTNVCEGMILAAERGQGGEIYFLTDGEPVEFRAFITALLKTQGIDPGHRSIPGWLARTVAWWSEWSWRILRLKGVPPLTRATARVIGEEVTVSDAKARRELGYKGEVSREAGLAVMASTSRATSIDRVL